MAARRAVLAGVLSSVEALVDDSDDVMNVVVSECSEASALLTFALQQAACEEEPTRTAVTVDNFMEVTAPSYSDTEFAQHFRMSRNCFEVNRQLQFRRIVYCTVNVE